MTDMQAAKEIAAHYGQGKAVELKGMAHDLMLVGPHGTAMQLVRTRSLIELTRQLS